jgi:serine protease Do
MADNLGFAIPVNYVKQFLHHREAFSFDKANPNSGYRYPDPPRRVLAGRPEGLKDRPAGEKPPTSSAGDKAPRGDRKGASR